MDDNKNLIDINGVEEGLLNMLWGYLEPFCLPLLL